MKYFHDMLTCLIFLKIVLSNNDNCIKMSQINGENLYSDQHYAYFTDSQNRENDNDLNQFLQSQQLFQIIEEFPLNIDIEQIRDFKIFIDVEKQLFRFSILNVNKSYIQISYNSDINNDLVEEHILNQSKLKMIKTNQIRNTSLCNQFDEIQNLNYYIYCFQDNLLNIYTINEDEQVNLYFEYNFTDYDFNSKKSIRYMKNIKIIFVIIYNRDKCETYKIDQNKQIKRILEINKDTYQYEEIFSIQFFQEQFLQIYFPNDSIMFDLLTSELKAYNNITFFNQFGKVDANYIIRITNQQKEEYLINNSNKTIILNSKSQIPQFLIYYSKLVLLYSNHIEIIDSGIVRQTMNKSIQNIQNLFSNYLIGLDNQNNLFVARLNYLTKNKRVQFVDDKPLILYLYKIYIFRSFYYIGCFEVNQITYEQQEYERKQNYYDFFQQTYFLKVISVDNQFLLNKINLSFKLQFYFLSLDYGKFKIQHYDQYNLNQQIRNYINLNQYFYFFGSQLIIQCQQNNLVTIYNGFTHQVERFRLSCDSEFGSIVNLIQNDNIFVLTKDHFGIIQFEIRKYNNHKFRTEYKGQFNLRNYITKITLEDNYLIAYHSNCTISLFDKFMKFIGIKYLFIGKESNQCQILNIINSNQEKQIIFYEQDLMQITDYQKTSLIKKLNKSIFCFIYHNVKMIYICAHKILNIFYTYELQYDNLIEISELMLFNFKIKRPIDFKFISNIISVVCIIDQQLYLLTMYLEKNNNLELSKITKIFNLNYFLDDQSIKYVTNQNQVEYLPFYLYQVELINYLKDQTNTKNITLLVEYIQNQTQIQSNLTINFEIDYKFNFPQLIIDHINSLVYKVGEKNVLNIGNFVNGPIQKVQLLHQSQALLIPPHIVLLNQSNKCQQRINDICLYNDQFKFLIIYNELQNISKNTSLQIDVCRVFIAYFDIKNELLIVVQSYLEGLLDFYYRNNKRIQFSFQGTVQSYQLMDYLLLIQSNINQLIIRIYQDELIIEKQLHQQSQFIQISLLQETYYIAFIKQFNTISKINGTIIRNRDQEIISTFELQVESLIFQNCLNEYIAFDNFSLLNGTYNQTNLISEIQIVIYSESKSFIFILQFSQQTVIKLECLGFVFYPLNEQLSSVLYQDKNYLILKFIKSTWLYKLNYNQFNIYYPVYQFNSTNIISQQQNYQFCQPIVFNIQYQNQIQLNGEYEILLEKENHNQTLEFVASYNESKIRFDLVLLIDPIKTSNQYLEINPIIIIIVILLCLILIIYLLLNNKKDFKNLNQNNFEIELKQNQVKCIQR